MASKQPFVAICPNCQAEAGEADLCPDCFAPLGRASAADTPLERMKQAAAPLPSEPLHVPTAPLRVAQAPPPPRSTAPLWVAAALVATTLGIGAAKLTQAPPPPPPVTAADVQRLYDVHFYRDAIAQGRLYLKTHPDDDKVRLLVARSEEQTTEWQAASEDYRILRKHSPTHQAALAQALQKWSSQRLETARQALKSGNVTLAISEGQGALAHLKPAQRGAAHTVIGEAAYLAGNFPLAVQELRQGDPSGKATLARAQQKLAAAPAPGDYIPNTPLAKAPAAAAPAPFQPGLGGSAYPTYHKPEPSPTVEVYVPQARAPWPTTALPPVAAQPVRPLTPYPPVNPRPRRVTPSQESYLHHR